MPVRPIQGKRSGRGRRAKGPAWLSKQKSVLLAIAKKEGSLMLLLPHSAVLIHSSIVLSHGIGAIVPQSGTADNLQLRKDRHVSHKPAIETSSAHLFFLSHATTSRHPANVNVQLGNLATTGTVLLALRSCPPSKIVQPSPATASPACGCFPQCAHPVRASAPDTQG